jgi:Na+-translocating ferredoxin:NAD+ oxidoreductase subunit B
MLAAVLVLVSIAAITSGLLTYAARRYATQGETLSEAIDALLPQTQCAQCGYPGCRPYASAIARGDADINLCPPGGPSTVKLIANLLGREATPLIRSAKFDGPQVAAIDEGECIGCALCLKACPVDAILGAPRHMHTVLTRLCTGCELCIAPCPVDCITMQPLTAAIDLAMTQHAAADVSGLSAQRA